MQRHVRRVRQIYKSRRDLLATLLREAFGNDLEFRIPDGGVALWARARRVNVEAWAAAAISRGMAFQTARAFQFDKQPGPYARLGYASHGDEELREAVCRLRLAFEDLQERHSA